MTRIPFTVALFAMILAFNNPNVQADDGDYGGGSASFDQSKLKGIVWIISPKTGEKLPAPAGTVSNDPNQYDYIFACQVDEQNLHAACPDSQERCPPREDGTEGNLVIWRYAPRAIANPTWTEWTSMGGPTCLYDAQPEDVLPRIAARILQDFRDLPVAAGTLTAQPSPHTLVGAETNVFASAEEQQFDVTILGQQVQLTATPSQYTFNYGDGTTLGPGASHGGPIPEAEWGTKTRTSHLYSDTGNFDVTVTTSFTGTYSVNNGPALPITGTGEFTSAPQTLQVWRSVTRNYADDCNVNPLGEGCRTS